MLAFHRILLPLDGSQLAESVLPAVCTFAAAFRSTVLLLHVLERRAPASVHGERHLQAVAEAKQYLESIAIQLRDQGITVEYHAHDAPEGDIARSIAVHAEEEQVDLIALCTHGSGGISEMLFGSIAQRVLHRGTKPVLLLRPDAQGTLPAFRPEVVLAPLDATDAAEIALTPALQIAAALDASVHLVMVVPTAETLHSDRRPAFGMLPTATRNALEIEREDAETYLNELAAELGTPALHVTTEVRRGDTSAALIEEAAKPGVGLIVISTHGRAGIQAIWNASITAQLLARTHTPVLLLRRIAD